MPDNRPRSREKHVSEGQGNVYRRGSGLGTGPVGSGSGGSFNRPSGGGGGRRAAIGGGSTIIVLIIIAIALFSGNGSLLSSFLGDDGGSYQEDSYQSQGNTTNPHSSSGSQTSFSSSSNAAYSADMTVAPGSRDKRTVIKGNSDDTVTMMVYMCGTDLESKSGMASNDMAEMARADISDKINLLVYTGGCAGWKTRGISSEVNQIYQISDGGMTRIVDNDGSKKMTDPDTLSGFIRWCAANYPADRYELIFWDHGGGSVSGFGYDEKYKSSGAMSLSGIKKALADGGVTFDFVGFDACLMATAETAVMLDDYADYMIASEETEPGIGWYYTNWISALSKNTSMSTVEIGKNIIDDFTNACASKVNGQKTTLSIIDLAEFNNTVPEKLKNFSVSVSDLVTNDNYKTVSDARYQTREFAQSSKIDQVDLVNLAENMQTKEGKELAEALKGAVKYNRTSYNMTNAYGVSIYFPYRKAGYVDKAAKTFEDIGMDPAFTKCLKDTATMQTGGQLYAGGSSNPLGALTGSGYSEGSYGSADIFGSLLSSFLTDRSMAINGLEPEEAGFLEESTISGQDIGEYVNDNHLDSSDLFWSQNSDGDYVLKLSEEQWDLIHDIDLNMFVDDGNGYIDLGLDNIFDWDSDDNLVADISGTWITINGQIVPYYHTDTTELGGDAYAISGYVPIFLNGEKAELIVTFTNEEPEGFVAGAVYDYEKENTETVAKSLDQVQSGDVIDFICDYYTYDGKYENSYMEGEELKVIGDLKVGELAVGADHLLISYRLTDIYNNVYWTPIIER